MIRRKLGCCDDSRAFFVGRCPSLADGALAGLWAGLDGLRLSWGDEALAGLVALDGLRPSLGDGAPAGLGQ